MGLCLAIIADSSVSRSSNSYVVRNSGEASTLCSPLPSICNRFLQGCNLSPPGGIFGTPESSALLYLNRLRWSRTRRRVNSNPLSRHCGDRGKPYAIIRATEESASKAATTSRDPSLRRSASASSRHRNVITLEVWAFDVTRHGSSRASAVSSISFLGFP